MSRCHCRCRKCDKRVVLKSAPGPNRKCKVPGCGGTLRPDRWMNQRNTSPRQGGMGCICPGYWFTHCKGSLFCWYRKDNSYRLPGDPDFQQRDWP